jgi:putative ABC transport system permease protein
VKDFHIASLHQPIEPTCIMFFKDAPWGTTDITLQIGKGETAQAMACLQKEWKEVFPDYPLDYQFYDEWFNQMYTKDQRFANAIGLFAFLAITISCLGILGLSIFSSERRAKEIGIRKVHGASVKELMILLNRDFVKWVATAFVIAAPIGWYAMNKWLQDFAYRTEISWWIFLASGMIALIVALLTASWQTWRTSTRNPVEVLRYE